MTFLSVWPDGFAIRLHVAEQPSAQELSWLFDMLRGAYGR